MKLHLPKQLFTALLTAITLAAAPVAKGANELNLSTGTSFYASDYAYSFILNEDAFAESDTIVVAGYWGNAAGNSQNSNALVAIKNSDGSITLKIGQGGMASVGANAGLSASSGFTLHGSNQQTLGTTFQTGVVYTLKAIGGDGAMDPSLYTIAVTDNTNPEAPSVSVVNPNGTYAGNMNGGNTIYSAFNDDVATLISANGSNGNVADSNNLVWAGVASEGSTSAAWENSWNSIDGTVGAPVTNDSKLYFDATSTVAKEVNITDSVTAGSIAVYGDYAFAAAENAALTVGGKVTVNAGGSLSLKGSGAYALGSGTDSFVNSGSVTVESGAGLNLQGGYVEQSADASLVADGALTLGGTVSLYSAITANGTVTLNDVIFDLTHMVYVGKEYTYTLTLFDGTTVVDLTGVQATGGIDGWQYTMQNNGTVLATYAGNNLSYTGDGNASSVFTWDVGTEFTGGAFTAGDYVNIIGSDAIKLNSKLTADRVIFSAGESGKADVSFDADSNSLVVSHGVFIEDGVTVEINKSTGTVGFIQGAVTVESGGVLKFNKKDVTGYNGGASSMHTINVLSGGELHMMLGGDNNNETFAGTLNLDGKLVGKASSVSRWDLYGGNAAINVGAGESASTENVKLYLRQNDSVITVGKDALFTHKGDIARSSNEGNGALYKRGSGSMIVEGGVNITTLGVDAGAMTLQGNTTITNVNIASGSTLTLGKDDAASTSTHNITNLSGGTLKLEKNATLNKLTSVTGMTTITGSGTYVTGDSVAANLTGWTDSANWTGTVGISGMQITGNSGDANNLSKLGNANSTVKLSGVSGWLTGSSDAAGHPYAFDMILENGNHQFALKIGDGSSNNYYNFKGDVSGSGDIELNFSGPDNLRYIFSGDIAGWTSKDDEHPEIRNVSANKTNTVIFKEKASEVNVALTNEAGTLNVEVNTTDAATFSKAVDVTKLTLNQSATFNSTVSAGSIIVTSEKRITLAGTESYTLSGTISGDGALEKAGTGTLTLTDARLADVTVSGGKLIYQLADNAGKAVDHTLALTMGSGASFEKTGEGTLNVGTLENAQFGAGIVVSQGVLQYTGKSSEIAASPPKFVQLLQNVSTTGTGKVQIDGDAKFNWNTKTTDVRTTVVGCRVNVTGNLEINTWDSGADADGDSMARWVVQEGGLLDVGGKFWLTNKQKLVVDGGAVIAGSMHLGHDQNTGSYYSKVVLTGGSITTGNFTFIGNGHTVAMTGGTLTFAPGTDGAEVLVDGKTSNSNSGAGTISFSGGKLAATTSGWSMTGTSALRLSLGDVTLDIAAGKTVTLGGSYDLTGTLSLIGNTVEVDGATTTGTLALTGTMNITSLQNLKQAEGQYTGGSDSRNGFSGYYYLVQNTDSATLNTDNLTVTLDGASTDRVSVVDNHLVISGSNGIFYVNAGSESATDSTMATDGFVRYHVEEDANLVISSGDTLASGNAAVVLTSTTGTGTMILDTDVTISGSDNGTVFEGTLKLDGSDLTGDSSYRTLTVGGDSTHANSVASLKEIVLAGQSKIQIKSNPMSETDIQKLTVAENGKGQLYIEDTHGAAMVIGEVQLKSGSGFTLDGELQDSAITIGKLSGSGSFTYESPSDSRQQVTIDSLLGFTGDMELDNSSAAGGYSAVINTGTGSAVDFGSLTAKGSGTVLNVQTNTTVDTIDAAGGTVNLSAGTTLTLGGETASTSTIGTLTADAAGNTIHLNSTATLNRPANVSGGTITLTGSGTYDMGASCAVNVNGLTDSSNWTGTVKLGGEVNCFGGVDDNGTDHRYGNASSTVVMCGASGWLYNGLISSILKLTKEGEGENERNGFTVTAASNWTHNFSNKVWGTGDFTVVGVGEGNPDYFFTGDLSEWSGAFEVSAALNSDLIVKMTGGGDLFAADGRGIVVTETATQTIYATLGSTDPAVKTTMRGEVTNNSESASLNLTVQGDTDFKKSVDVTSLTVNSGKTATLTGDANSMVIGNATITSKAETDAALSNVTVDAPAKKNTISATSTANGTKGSISNADVRIAQLAQDATFTIEDMTLMNTTITAATTETHVNLSNVSASNLALETGKFTMNAVPVVGLGGDTKATFNTGVSALTAGTATLTLNLDMIGAYESTGAVSGATLTITLGVSGADFSSYTVENWQALVGFDQGSWLGTMLEDQNATYQLADGAAQVAEGNSAPAVSYGYAAGDGGSNVGTLTITITGLNVPEPTTSTLSLLALAALAARRRRND